MDEQKINELKRAQELERVRSWEEERKKYENFASDKYLQKGDFRKFARGGFEDRRARMARQSGVEAEKRDKIEPAINKRGAVGKIRNAKDLAKTGKVALTAFSEISVSRDVGYFLVITISVLADLFSLVPVLGSVMAVLFAILIWMIYLINGHFKIKAAQQTISLVVAALFEIMPGLNLLPFFTASAVINYWIALAARKTKAAEEQKDAKNRQ